MELKRDIEKATRVAVRFKYNFLGSWGKRAWLGSFCCWCGRWQCRPSWYWYTFALPSDDLENLTFRLIAMARVTGPDALSQMWSPRASYVWQGRTDLSMEKECYQCSQHEPWHELTRRALRLLPFTILHCWSDTRVCLPSRLQSNLWRRFSVIYGKPSLVKKNILHASARLLTISTNLSCLH